MQPEPQDVPIETPIEDATEQAREADPLPANDDEIHEQTEAAEQSDVRRGLEVNEWDAAQQALTVEFSDDYR